MDFGIGINGTGSNKRFKGQGGVSILWLQPDWGNNVSIWNWKVFSNLAVWDRRQVSSVPFLLPRLVGLLIYTLCVRKL